MDLPELPNWHALGVMLLTLVTLYLFSRERIPIETTSMLVLALLSVVSMGIVHLGLHRAVIGAAEIPRLSGDVQTVEFDGTPMRIDTVKVSLERAHGVTACFADGIGPRTEVTLHLTELTPYTTNSPKQGNSDQH